VVNDSADVVTSSARSFHVFGLATGKSRLPTVRLSHAAQRGWVGMRVFSLQIKHLLYCKT